MSRLERILVKLAQNHARHLIPSGWDSGRDVIERVQWLARKLADYNVLVIVGELDPPLRNLQDLHVQDWVQNYARLYYLLTQSLLPSQTGISAYYADEHLPVVVVLEGQSAPVLGTFAGFVTPYVASQQTRDRISELELIGLMDVVLDELAADDLARPTYENLRAACVDVVKRLLQATMRHVSLTGFDRPILGTQPVVPSDPTPPPKPATTPSEPPSDLPEHTLEMLPDDDAPLAPTEQMFIDRLPLPRNPSDRTPPVPPLPDDKE